LRQKGYRRDLFPIRHLQQQLVGAQVYRCYTKRIRLCRCYQGKLQADQKDKPGRYDTLPPDQSGELSMYDEEKKKGMSDH